MRTVTGNGGRGASTSVAGLVRRFVDAMQSFGVPADALTAPADPSGMPPPPAGPPTFVGHMDIAPYHVVFTDGQAAALIGFRPGWPLIA